MSSELSVAKVLASLEAQMTLRRPSWIAAEVNPIRQRPSRSALKSAPFPWGTPPGRASLAQFLKDRKQNDWIIACNLAVYCFEFQNDLEKQAQ